MLNDAGHVVKFLAEPVVGKTSELLAGVGLLLLAPGSTTGCREAFLRSTVGMPAKIPVLQMLATATGGAPAGLHEHVPWPCTTEELKKRIDAILASGSQETSPQ